MADKLNHNIKNVYETSSELKTITGGECGIT